MKKSELEWWMRLRGCVSDRLSRPVKCFEFLRSIFKGVGLVGNWLEVVANWLVI